MAITKAMRDRHTVRKYIDKPLPPDVVKQLEQRILRLNAEHGTSLKLMVDDTRAFNFITRLVLAKGARNYVILAGFAEPGLAERLGKTYTVVWIKEGLLNGWKRAGGARGLRRCLERVFSERDGRRFFKAVWDKADATEQIKARVTERQRTIHDRRTFDADIRDAFSSRGTIRGAAEHFGMG